MFGLLIRKMRPLYVVIVLGIGMLYWVSTKQRDEKEQVKSGAISEGDYSQEAPPSMEETNYIKRYVPDYSD